MTPANSALLLASCSLVGLGLTGIALLAACDWRRNRRMRRVQASGCCLHLSVHPCRPMRITTAPGVLRAMREARAQERKNLEDAARRGE